MKCWGITSNNHQLVIEHMVLMNACFCYKFFPVPSDLSSQCRRYQLVSWAGSGTTLRRAEIFKAMFCILWGYIMRPWFLISTPPRFATTPTTKPHCPNLPRRWIFKIFWPMCRSRVLTIASEVWSLTPLQERKHLLTAQSPQEWLEIGNKAGETHSLMENQLEKSEAMCTGGWVSYLLIKNQHLCQELN